MSGSAIKFDGIDIYNMVSPPIGGQTKTKIQRIAVAEKYRPIYEK